MSDNNFDNNFGIKGRIEQDTDPLSPIEGFDSVGTIIVRGSCRYTLGHEQAENPIDFVKKQSPIAVCLPIYIYDHSGITISTTPFSCQWDSGQIGYIYTTEAKAIDEFGEDWTKEQIEKVLVSEVKTYDDFLTGNCWGYVIEDAEGEFLDSCHGFIGEKDYCRKEMEFMIKYYVKLAKQEFDKQAEKYPVRNWRLDVSLGNTVLGWNEWRDQMVESEDS